MIVGTGGTAAFALWAAGGLGWASTAASLAQLGAGAAAGDKYHVKNGMIGFTFGVLTGGTWGAVSGAGAAAFATGSRLVIYETGGRSIEKGKC